MQCLQIIYLSNYYKIFKIRSADIKTIYIMTGKVVLIASGPNKQVTIQ